jgi:hypothetical protein
MGKMLRTIMAELQHMKFVTKVFRFGQKLRKITLKLILPNKFSHSKTFFFSYSIQYSSLLASQKFSLFCRSWPTPSFGCPAEAAPHWQ